MTGIEIIILTAVIGVFLSILAIIVSIGVENYMKAKRRQ